MYTTRYCPFCTRAKQILDAKGVAYVEISVDGDASLRSEMMQKSGRHTVPQIWVADKHIGGCDELSSLERSGQLDSMLQLAGLEV
jgi:glutaredoxin 3